MKETIKNLLQQIKDKWFCLHDWEQWKTIHVETDLGSTYSVYHFRCKKCGKFKKVKSY